MAELQRQRKEKKKKRDRAGKRKKGGNVDGEARASSIVSERKDRAAIGYENEGKSKKSAWPFGTKQHE